jgi:hypothetical protein
VSELLPAVGNELEPALASEPAEPLPAGCEPIAPEPAWPTLPSEPAAVGGTGLTPVPANPVELVAAAPVAPPAAVSPHAQLPYTPFAPHVIVPSPLEHEQLTCVAGVQPDVREGTLSPEPQPTTHRDTATLAATQKNFI